MDFDLFLKCAARYSDWRHDDNIIKQTKFKQCLFCKKHYCELCLKLETEAFPQCVYRCEQCRTNHIIINAFRRNSSNKER